MAAVSILETLFPPAQIIIPSQHCSAKSNNIILDTAFYNSGDQVLKDFLGQLIMLNTVSCDSVKFSY